VRQDDFWPGFIPRARERFRLLETEYGFSVTGARPVAFRDVGWVAYRNDDRVVIVEGDHEGGSIVDVVFDPKRNIVPRRGGIHGPLLLTDVLALCAPAANIALAHAQEWMARLDLVADVLPRYADDLLQGTEEVVSLVAELRRLQAALQLHPCRVA
jgi:hypothetical protein